MKFSTYNFEVLGIKGMETGQKIPPNPRVLKL